MLNGIERIAAERQRQIDKENWTADHDDDHTEGQLGQAAECYLHSYAHGKDRRLPDNWPWECHWWKPSKNRIRNLEKAGALIAAEIDRLLRLEAEEEPR